MVDCGSTVVVDSNCEVVGSDNGFVVVEGTALSVDGFSVDSISVDSLSVDSVDGISVDGDSVTV